MISKNLDPVNEFSPELWQLLKSRLQKAAAETSGPRFAAFDADGKLWDHDAGETFFDWQIHNSNLATLPLDPWAHYHALKNPDPRVAYLWLAQISQGTTLIQMRQWAEACFREQAPWPVFSSQRRLIEFLRSLNFEIYVVTASIKWAVEPPAKLLGIDADHVIGITTEIIDNRIGHKGVEPITWRQGKAEAILKATGGVRPLLACGNTYGDTALIETATAVSLAVSTQDKHGPLFEEERKLREEAQGKSWLMHAFRTLPAT
jgi:phosphoserine phosphatase